MKEKNYSLVGILNLFDLIPNFVYVVYEKNNNFFFAKAEYDNLKKINKIKSFVEIEKEYYSKITFLKDLETLGKLPNSVNIGDSCIVAFQLENNKLQIGTQKELKEFLKDFKTDDFLLQQEIDDFLNYTNT